MRSPAYRFALYMREARTPLLLMCLCSRWVAAKKKERSYGVLFIILVPYRVSVLAGLEITEDGGSLDSVDVAVQYGRHWGFARKYPPFTLYHFLANTKLPAQAKSAMILVYS